MIFSLRIAVFKLLEYTGEFRKLATAFTKQQNLNENSECHITQRKLDSRLKYKELYVRKMIHNKAKLFSKLNRSEMSTIQIY